jgi:hypothetical protein
MRRLGIGGRSRDGTMPAPGPPMRSFGRFYGPVTEPPGADG